MGLDKDTASARISRYESESMAVSLESLFILAEALEVPPAYLLANTPVMADAILRLGTMSEAQLAHLLGALTTLSGFSGEQSQELNASTQGNVDPSGSK